MAGTALDFRALTEHALQRGVDIGNPTALQRHIARHKLDLDPELAKVINPLKPGEKVLDAVQKAMPDTDPKAIVGDVFKGLSEWQQGPVRQIVDNLTLSGATKVVLGVGAALSSVVLAPFDFGKAAINFNRSNGGTTGTTVTGSLVNGLANFFRPSGSNAFTGNGSGGKSGVAAVGDMAAAVAVAPVAAGPVAPASGAPALVEGGETRSFAVAGSAPAAATSLVLAETPALAAAAPAASAAVTVAPPASAAAPGPAPANAAPAQSPRERHEAAIRAEVQAALAIEKARDSSKANSAGLTGVFERLEGTQRLILGQNHKKGVDPESNAYKGLTLSEVAEMKIQVLREEMNAPEEKRIKAEVAKINPEYLKPEYAAP